jgi:hypothetical protein
MSVHTLKENQEALPLRRLGAFSRASERIRALPGTDASRPLQELLTYCKELAVSYTGLLLTMDMFPQVGASDASSAIVRHVQPCPKALQSRSVAA